MAGRANFSGVIGRLLLQVLVVTLVASTGETAQIEISCEVTVCTARFNIQQFYVLPTQCIYVFCMDLRTNRLFPCTTLTRWFL
jgi:hypothetical protein